MKDELTCDGARIYLDKREPLNTDEVRRLDMHLTACASCAAVAAIEVVIRDVVAKPDNLPALPVNFELKLRTRLGIRKAAAPDPVAKWGWVAGVMTLVTIAYPYLSGIFGEIVEYIELLFSQAPQVYSQTGSAAEPMLRGVLQIPGQGEAMTLSLILGAVVLLGGIITVSIIDRD